MKINSLIKSKVFLIMQVGLVFLLTISIAGYFSFLGVDPHHDGIMLKPASDIAKGQMLFRDTFNQYGALTTIFQSWTLTVFGHYLIVIKLLTVFFYGLIAVVLWLIWSLFLPEVLATGACSIWLFLAPYHHPDCYFLPWSSVYALFFQLVTLYSLLRFLQTKKNLWQIIAGISIALTFWCRQPVGVFLFGSVLFFLFILRLKKYKIGSMSLFYISCVLTHSIFIIWLCVNNAFFDWIQQTIYIPTVWAIGSPRDKISTFFFFLGNIFPKSDSPISIWTLMPLSIFYLGFTSILKKKLTNIHVFIILVTCVSLASWLQYHPVSDIRHLYWAATPMIGFCIFAALMIGGLNKKKSLVMVIICIVLFVPDMVNHVRNARRKILKYWSYPTLIKPEVLKGMKVPPKEKKFFEDSMNVIEKYQINNPRSFITTTSMDALYSLFDGKNINCHKLTVYWGWKSYDLQLEKNYVKAMQICIAKYKPAIFTQEMFYHPTGYSRVTKGESWTGNYLILPKSP